MKSLQNFLVFTLVLATFPSTAIMAQASATSITGTVTIIQHPSIIVFPTSGPGESNPILSGSNFAPDQKIKITFANSDMRSELGTVTADDTGAFAKLVTVPAKVYPGSYAIYAESRDVRLASASFVVPFPALIINPAYGSKGSVVTATGSNFALDRGVDVFIGSDITHHLKHIGRVRTDDAGSFTTQVRIPNDVSAGVYFISAREDVNRNVYAAAPFTVLATLTSNTASSSHDPSTFGQLVVFAARVLPAPDGGTAIFYDDTAALGSGHVEENGRATFGTSALSAGAHIVAATYSDDSSFVASTGAVLIQTVMKASHE